MAIGAATATPHPVPQLIVASVRARTASGRPSTASANGGYTSPALAPAIATPAPSSAGPSASATTTVPATANKPPATTVVRSPARATTRVTSAAASTYAT